MLRNTPEPSYRQALREVAADLAGQRDQLLRVHGTLALRIGDLTQPLALEAALFTSAHGMEGVQMALLPSPHGATYSHMSVVGRVGVRCEKVSVHHHVRIYVLQGRLRWWQANTGNQAREVVAGQTLEIAPHEEHGFEVLEEYHSYNVFTPPL
ncbi:cupin domain-containing protein [Hymenobacter mucosus]|uniref:Cupin domain-containing protein n=1 Tax=Hymenobacter mucosus TaxID=1411120 RepID=A0A239ABU0_9BACT|nr:hypothetical protein [Hymenobacter mucosus]SNR92801.1 hypothetical protein SAMN06269173_111122 [Hymenobacter mucosus]